MRKYLNSPVKDYLKELSSRTTVPGGGSAAAVEAALGVALNLMVLNYSIKPSVKEAVRKELSIAKKIQEKSLKSLIALADKDSAAFSALMKALSSGKSARKAYVRAAAAPLDVCRECLVSLEIAEKLVSKGNKNLITDVGCAVVMLASAFQSARYNVLINLKYMDKAVARKAHKELDLMAAFIEKTGSRLKRAVLNKL